MEFPSPGMGRLRRRPSGEPGGPRGGDRLSTVEACRQIGAWDTGSARKEDLSGAGRDARTAWERCAWSPSSWQALRLLICEMGALTLAPEAGCFLWGGDCHQQELLRPI